MFKFVCLFVLIAAAHAASIGTAESTTERKEIIPVLRFETDKKPDGSFSFAYEGGDKSFREESAVLENAGTDDEALEVSGSYRYIDADGQEIEVHYTAGKNGFVPIGTNIPSEISALAKAAADLPDQSVEEEFARKGRSKETKENVKKATEPVVKGLKADKVEAKPARLEAKVEATAVKVEKAEEKKPEEKKAEEPKVEEKKAGVKA